MTSEYHIPFPRCLFLGGVLDGRGGDSLDPIYKAVSVDTREIHIYRYMGSKKATCRRLGTSYFCLTGKTRL